MEAMSVQTKLHLHAPPVVETAIQIQFSDLPRWNSVHHGLYFPKIRARYPHFELIPEIPPVVETFPPSPKRLQLQLTARQDPGCAQFESLNHDRLIRVQRNRFAFHWKSIVSGESTNYPHYEANIRSFVDEFAVFQEFCFVQGIRTNGEGQRRRLHHQESKSTETQYGLCNSEVGDSNACNECSTFLA